MSSATAAAAAAKSLQSCLTLCDPVDGSPPGSSVHWIFQAIVLEWGAIAFSMPPLNSCLFFRVHVITSSLDPSSLCRFSTYVLHKQLVSLHLSTLPLIAHATVL